MQGLPSSLTRQSAAVWHSQVLVPGWHFPNRQTSFLVHGSPSLHRVPLSTTDMAHLPVLGLQVFLTQSLSLTVLQLTTVAGLFWHLGGFNALLQKSMPLQRSPSSSSAQSLSDWHEQVNVPAMHLPALHVSPVVQLSPSSQANGPLSPASPGCLSTHLQVCLSDPTQFSLTSSLWVNWHLLVLA